MNILRNTIIWTEVLYVRNTRRYVDGWDGKKHAVNLRRKSSGASEISQRTRERFISEMFINEHAESKQNKKQKVMENSY